MIPLRDDNPTRITPVLTWGLIAVNVMVFLYQVSLGPRQGRLFVYEFGAIPAVVMGTEALPGYLAAIPPQISLFTNMFLHGGLFKRKGVRFFNPPQYRSHPDARRMMDLE